MERIEIVAQLVAAKNISTSFGSLDETIRRKTMANMVETCALLADLIIEEDRTWQEKNSSETG